MTNKVNYTDEEKLIVDDINLGNYKSINRNKFKKMKKIS